MPAPEVSVVIAASRPTRLAFALEALAAQTLARERFEVIVVRDGDPGLWPVPPAELALRIVNGGGDGNIAALRNRGWRVARGALVAFTDDDCRPAPNWLEALLTASGDPLTVLQGRTEPDPVELHLHNGLARTQRITELGGWYETCNMAYPRALVERLGGFDERFAAIGEDTDLAWRAIEAGARTRFVDDALVWHAVLSRSIPRAFAEVLRLRDAPAVVARHPGLHDSLYRRHFWNSGHLRIIPVLLTLPLLRRRRLMGSIAWLAYAQLKINWREPRPRSIVRVLLGLPLFAALEAAELLARLPAAVRHRVPVI